MGWVVAWDGCLLQGVEVGVYAWRGGCMEGVCAAWDGLRTPEAPLGLPPTPEAPLGLPPTPEAPLAQHR